MANRVAAPTCSAGVARRSFAELCVAVVGYGSIGHRHARNLADLGVGQLVAMRRSTRRNEAFSPGPSTQIVTSPDELFAFSPDLAIVANPTSLHVATARPLLEAGIPLVIEKPLASDFVEAAEFVATACRLGSWVSMAYPLRFHPAYAIARQLLCEGGIGKVAYGDVWFESYLPEWHPWEDYRESYAAREDLGGGVLPTVDHEIDFVNWILGSPTAVSGCCARTGALEARVADMATIVTRYGDGASAAIRLSLARKDRQRGFHFVGARGALGFDWGEGRLKRWTAGSAVPAVLWTDPGDATGQMYRTMIAKMLDCLVNGAEAPTPLESGLATLDVCRRVAAA